MNDQEPQLILAQRNLVRDLVRLSADRSKGETAADTARRSRTKSLDTQMAEAREKLRTRCETDTAAAEQQFAAAKSEAEAAYQRDFGPTEAEYGRIRQQVASQFASAQEEAHHHWEESQWLDSTVSEGQTDSSASGFEKFQHQVTKRIEHLRTTWEEANKTLAEFRHADLQSEVVASTAPDPISSDPFNQLVECDTSAETQLVALKGLSIPRTLRSWKLVWPFLLLLIVAVVPAVLFAPAEMRLMAGPAAAVVVVVIYLIVRTTMGSMAGRQIEAAYRPIAKAVMTAESARELAGKQMAERYRKQVMEIEQQQKREKQKAEQHYKQTLAGLEKQRDQELKQADEKYPKRLAEIKQRRVEALRAAEEKYPKLIAEIKARYQRDSQELERRYTQQREKLLADVEEAWNKLIATWRDGIAAVHQGMADNQAEAARMFPDWSAPLWQKWQPVEATPPVLQIGQYQIATSRVPGGIPEDPRLQGVVQESYTLPALLPFEQARSLLFQCTGAGRDQAVLAIQVAMLRMLTSLPPGKVRFCIVDPVGLGQNFAAFMHLADHNEQFVTNRIWTEPAQIEQRLADLTEQMENVIQKYLRNEFETIEQYNQNAGEVAEPFRFLVVANFPANFTEAAAKRLVSVAHSGARCGVHTIVSVDTKQQLPAGFDLKELQSHSITLTWKDKEQRFVCPESNFKDFPLALDTPPDADFFSRVLHQVGKIAKDASKVEVPFEFIAPKPEEWWKSDSRAGVHVALGRAGATKRQHLDLGLGTSQHVLIAGKTGSGKSTLLHALITNTVLCYSPDEVELYLIDFKKGVEFKTYAEHKLPHASVIAIESEREFGLSVLERLDLELKVRGDRFRDLGVQDLKGYRNLGTEPPLARVMLIVDEFQELFVEDDKVAQDSALLLDRLVRQGRAFGVHVLLGSQTLGGAYSLARSTLGQMAVRIALQCSENDAHLILSEDNSAARLLSRPGEAIYNDSNGMVEGNNPFQVVWLSDSRRERYLLDVAEMYRQKYGDRKKVQLVFEGNTTADATQNVQLGRLLNAPAWGEVPRVVPAWLGDSVAIKDPTAALFSSQSGNNMLLVGQRDEASLGIMATTLVSLAAQHPPGLPGVAGGAKFYLFDGSSPESPCHGQLEHLVDAVPHPVQAVSARNLPTAIGEVYDEIQRRQASGQGEEGSIYLFIYDLGRLRDLRKQEDDYGFGRSDSGRPSTAKQFSSILRDGPPLGIHTVVWCDTVNNLNRTLERQGIREFEILVLFQLSANDSSSLIDSPAASKLGPHRAFMYREDQNKLEKFRPYGPPTPEWLAEVHSKLSARPVPEPTLPINPPSAPSPTAGDSNLAGGGMALDDDEFSRPFFSSTRRSAEPSEPPADGNGGPHGLENDSAGAGFDRDSTPSDIGSSET